MVVYLGLASTIWMQLAVFHQTGDTTPTLKFWFDKTQNRFFILFFSTRPPVRLDGAESAVYIIIVYFTQRWGFFVRLAFLCGDVFPEWLFGKPNKWQLLGNLDSIFNNIYVAKDWLIIVAQPNLILTERGSDVYRRQILTSKVDARTERVKYFNGRRPLAYMYSNEAETAN